MISKITIILGIIIIFVLSSLYMSCATIIKGTNQDISISSSPSQADVVVKTIGGIEVFRGKTPASVKLAKKQKYTVTVALQGYKEQQIMVDQAFEPFTLGNLICGGVIGLIVDAVDGAMWKLEPDMINLTLVTASLRDGTTDTYAVFCGKDSEGQLKWIVIPMIRL